MHTGERQRRWHSLILSAALCEGVAASGVLAINERCSRIIKVFRIFEKNIARGVYLLHHLIIVVLCAMNFLWYYLKGKLLYFLFLWFSFPIIVLCVYSLVVQSQLNFLIINGYKNYCHMKCSLLMVWFEDIIRYFVSNDENLF